MSRNPDDYLPEARTATALERIADTLDDYMAMSLAAQEMAGLAAARDPRIAELYAPLLAAIKEIAARRAERY